MRAVEKLPKTESAWRNLLASNKPGVVRNMRDWKKLLASEENPLKGVDPKIVREFTKNLKFKGLGLGHANYAMIQDLPFRRFVRLWGHFGLSLDLFADYNNMKCSGRATCSTSITDICTSNC